MKRLFFGCHLSRLSENCIFFRICFPSSFADFWRGWVFLSVSKGIWNQCPDKRCSGYTREPPPAASNTHPVCGMHGNPPRSGGRGHRCPKHTAGVPLPPPHHPSLPIPEAPHTTEARLSLCDLPVNQGPKKSKTIMKTTCKSSPQFLQCL